MVTVINRPLGHKLTDADVEASVTDSGAGALFNTLFAHGLVDGDYVYIQGPIESYNGFKYVDSFAYNSFRIRESEDGDFVFFKQTADVSYRVSVLQHGWLAISQPIVYELESNLWPNNEPEESYTPRIVDSQADAEGYTQLNLSAPLSSPFALDFIELVGTGSLAGAYQIITVLQPWSVIINLAYSASNSFSGYQVVKYYNNYCINVDVYAGLGVEHPWYSEKPYALLATLRFTPGEDGRVKFSISDILKGYINTRNNLTLDTLPNNLDFMTGFYIAYYESYDSSDGTEISTLSSAPTSDRDEFEGHAVNADMPFKSLYISHMSEYLNEDTYLAKWLVLQTNPYGIIGYFMDISFINQFVNNDIQILENGELYTVIESPGEGVIRIPLEWDSVGQYCYQAIALPTASSGGGETPLADFPDISLFINQGTGDSWTTGATPSVNVTGGTSKILRSPAYAFSLGVTYKIVATYTKVYNSGSGIVHEIALRATDSANSPFFTDLEDTTTGSTTGTLEIQFIAASALMDRVNLEVDDSSNVTVTINSFSVSTISPVIPGNPGGIITEQLCITVLEECDDTFISDEDIRLTEDGDFRILE
jgi:hypothetical protein